MKSKWTMLASAALAALALATTPVHAQRIVYDPTNYAQNMIQAARALEQIRNQIRAIEQQAQMLARNPLQLSPELSQSIEEARGLLVTAQGLAFDIDRIGEDLRTLYPRTWESFELGHLVDQSNAWAQQSRQSLETAMRAEANAVRAIERQRGQIDSALSASANAQGQTSAVQAGNQLLGVTAAQLAQIQTLLAAQGRALETERLERIAREQRAREIERRAFPTETQTPDPARTAF